MMRVASANPERVERTNPKMSMFLNAGCSTPSGVVVSWFTVCLRVAPGAIIVKPLFGVWIDMLYRGCYRNYDIKIKSIPGLKMVFSYVASNRLFWIFPGMNLMGMILKSPPNPGGIERE